MGSGTVGIGSVSSARLPGVRGSISYGNETNALDVFAEAYQIEPGTGQISEVGKGSINLTGSVGGKYGIGIAGFSYEYRQSADDLLASKFGGNGRVSVSLLGMRVRVTEGVDGLVVDLGIGGTVGFGSGFSLFGGMRLDGDGGHLIGSGSGNLAPNLVGPIGVGLGVDVVSDPFVGPGVQSSTPVADAISELHEQFPDVPLEELEATALAAISEHDVRMLWGRNVRSEATKVEALLDPAYSAALMETLEAAQHYYRNTRSDPGAPEEPVVPPTDNRNDGTSDGDGGDDGAATTSPPSDKTGVVTSIKGPPGATGSVYKDPYIDGFDDGYGGATIPIILDLDGDGVEVAFGEDIYFDLDDDGFLEQTSWAAADDGFLVIDRNADGSRGAGDGVIDQSNELVLSSLGLEGDTDLQALARYDDNGDGKLDARDAIWNELKVWQELNQDGKTEGDGTAFKAAPQ